MIELARDTMPRASKGPIAEPPSLTGVMKVVAETIASWPGVVATAHWHLYDSSRMDGVDFYVEEQELGHIHLDGSIHLATCPSLGKSLIARGLALRFPYARGWVQQQLSTDHDAVVNLFEQNYKHLVSM